MQRAFTNALVVLVAFAIGWYLGESGILTNGVPIFNKSIAAADPSSNTQVFHMKSGEDVAEIKVSAKIIPKQEILGPKAPEYLKVAPVPTSTTPKAEPTRRRKLA